MTPRRLVLTALVVTLVLPTAAHAKARVGVADNDPRLFVKPTDVTCPQGTRVTGGGFRTPVPTNAGSIRIDESRKIGQRTWRISATRDGAGPTRYTAYAYCSATAPATTAFAKVEKFASNATSTARCGSGVALSGGLRYSVFPGSDLLFWRSAPVARKGWRSALMNLGGDGGADLTSFAYCADVKAPVLRSGSTATATHAALVTALSPAAPDGAEPLSGGFDQPAASPSAFHQVYESVLVGRRWRVRARHLGRERTTLRATLVTRALR